VTDVTRPYSRVQSIMDAISYVVAVAPSKTKIQIMTVLRVGRVVQSLLERSPRGLNQEGDHDWEAIRCRPQPFRKVVTRALQKKKKSKS